MFFDFGLGEPMTVRLEIYVGNQLVQQQMLSAPVPMLMAQFQQLCQEIGARKPQPMTVRFVRTEDIWDRFDQKVITKEFELACANYEREWG